MINQNRYSLLLLLALIGLFCSIIHAFFIILNLGFVFLCFYRPCNWLNNKLLNRDMVLPYFNSRLVRVYWFDYFWLGLFLVYWGGMWSILGEVANCLSGFPYWYSPFSFCYAQ